MATTKAKTFSLQIEAKALIFQGLRDHNGEDPHRYVVLPERMDYIEFMKKYQQGPHDAVQCTPVEIGDYDRYFKMCIADCYDPPLAIVCARNECDAIEAFMDGVTWGRVEEPDLKDYKDEDLEWDSNGNPHDLSGLHMEEVKLVGVEF